MALKNRIDHGIAGWILPLAVVLLAVSGCRRAIDHSFPAVIEGASMAPHFWGAHWESNCDECGIKFDCDVKVPASGQFVCPNCGIEFLAEVQSRMMKPPVYSVASFGDQPPRRWQVVAISPTIADTPFALIKRIAGLPGETLEFRHGDLFIDGKLTRKTWSEIDEMKILVFDSSYVAKSTLPSRLIGMPVDCWTQDEEGCLVKQRTGPEGKQPTLRFVNWRCCAQTEPRETPRPVEDYYAANQSLTCRLHPVDQLVFEFEMDVSDAPTFSTIVHTMNRELRCQFDFGEANLITLYSGTELVKTWTIPEHNGRVRIELSTVDQQVAIRIDSKELPFHILADATVAGRDSAGSDVFEINSDGRSLSLCRLQIWRDIYWSDLNEPLQVNQDSALGVDDASKNYSISPDSYFVVGDNVPVSKDSRYWAEPFVHRSRILGQIIASDLQSETK